MKTTVVIPTYNEAENIEAICQEILKYLPAANIIIVDDDSQDGTEKIARLLSQKNNQIRFINRKGKKRSFAQSYIDGFKEALKNNADYIIQMDADFSHNPRYLHKMLEELKNHDVIIGSRYIRGGKIDNWSFWRRLISRSGSIYSRLIAGLPFADSTSGFVGWGVEALKKINLDKIHSEGYAFQIEMKFYAYKNNFKIREIPITFIDRKFGASKMSKRIILEAALCCPKLRFKNSQPIALNDEKIKDYYRHIENYDWTHASDSFVGLETFLHRNRSKIITQLIRQNLPKTGKCLDIGCGTGFITRHLPPGSIGLDINPRNLEKAKKYVPQITFIEGDAEKTNFSDRSFDLVVCTEVLEHLPNPTKVITEIKRVIKPNGILLGSVPTNSFIWKLRFLSKTCGAKEPYHKHYPKSEITNLLKNNFKEITIISDIVRMNWFFACRYQKNKKFYEF